ncbi:MAG: Tim44 domain-containing protein, partial [Betaproteobacteria bacterium]|nr:Tim44 domain-containing protein [Betaproteobacteria bacterium]
MKRFSVLITVLFIALSLFSLSAEAKRFGGGGSFGKQRSIPMQRQAQPTPPPQQSPAAAPAPAGNRWLGPLAGLAAGVGLASLFGGGMGGMSGGMGGILWVLIAIGAAMFFWSRLIKPQPAQYAGMPYEPQQAPPIMVGSTSSTSNIPADFPVESFIRNGKMSFIRLQAANDRKDM